MKTKPLTFLFALTFLFLFSGSSLVVASDSHDAVIKEIRFLFSKWQPILKNVQKEGVKKSKTLTLGEEGILFIESDFGYFINWEVDYRSGDHFLSGDHYYNKKGELYFVFFRFKSFHGLNPKYWALDGTIIPSAEADPTISLQIPVTVERRLYFDQTGKIIRELESVYHMNTKEKTHRGYIHSDEHKKHMSYSYHLNELKFYKLLEDSPILDSEIVKDTKVDGGKYSNKHSKIKKQKESFVGKPSTITANDSQREKERDDKILKEIPSHEGEPEVKHEYWGNGKLKSEEHYKDGKENGVWTWWYENGKKKRELHITKGVPRFSATWYKNGQKKSEVHFKKDKKKENLPIDSFEHHMLKVTYDTKVGVEREWYENGNKKRETHYKDGKRDGPSIAWYPDGTRRYEEHYKEGNFVDRNEQ